MKTEKIENGKMYWWKDGVLNGEWIEYSPEELVIKVQELELRLEQYPFQDGNLYEKGPWWANPNIGPMDITC